MEVAAGASPCKGPQGRGLALQGNEASQSHYFSDPTETGFTVLDHYVTACTCALPLGSAPAKAMTPIHRPVQPAQ